MNTHHQILFSSILLQNKVIPTTQMPTSKRRNQLMYLHCNTYWIENVKDTRDTYIIRLSNHKLSHKTHKTVPSEDIFAERNFNLIKIISTYRSKPCVGHRGQKD